MFLFFQLCTVTLSLFETLVGLNCEDVMLWLVFRHLIPMTYLLPSQRASLHLMPDMHGRGAQKLLSLVPICCTEASAAAAGAGDTYSSAGGPSSPRLIAQQESINNRTSQSSSSAAVSLNFFLTSHL